MPISLILGEITTPHLGVVRSIHQVPHDTTLGRGTFNTPSAWYIKALCLRDSETASASDALTLNCACHSPWPFTLRFWIRIRRTSRRTLPAGKVIVLFFLNRGTARMLTKISFKLLLLVKKYNISRTRLHTCSVGSFSARGLWLNINVIVCDERHPYKQRTVIPSAA